MFNSVIAYHPSDNPNLLYALLRAHRTFEDLGTFTLTRGLRDVRRMQLATEEQSHVQDTKGKSRATEEYDQPHQEKQRLLEREHAQSADSLTEVRVVPRDQHQQEPAGHVEEIPSSQPLMSPTIYQATFSSPPTVVSEKAGQNAGATILVVGYGQHLIAKRLRCLLTAEFTGNIVAAGVCCAVLRYDSPPTHSLLDSLLTR